MECGKLSIFGKVCISDDAMQKLYECDVLLSFAPCKRIQDSLGFLIPRCGFQIFQVFVSGTLNLDPNRYWDSGFLELYSGFQSPRPSIPKEKILFQIPESGYPYMGLSNPIGFSPDFRFFSKPTHPNFSSF